MRVLGAGINLQVPENGVAQTVLGEHAADRLLDGADRVLLEELGVGGCREAARVARVAVRLLLLQLGAGDG